MGYFETTMGKIMGAKSQILEVKLEAGHDAGIILRAATLEEVQQPEPQPPADPTFVDYLRGGWQINLSVAIDYTASNGN